MRRATGVTYSNSAMKTTACISLLLLLPGGCDKATKPEYVVCPPESEYSISYLKSLCDGKSSVAITQDITVYGFVTANDLYGEYDRMIVVEDGSDGKHAVTHYRVLKRYGYVTLIECRLETGRTHQIRVHMQWKGHPLFGDERYGGDRILKGTTFNKYKQFIENCFAAMPRQALHAKSLGFQHPTTGEQVYFESELPEDFRTVLAKWDAYAAAGLAEE